MIGNMLVRLESIAVLLPPDPITMPLGRTVAPVAPAAATVPTFVAPAMIALICDVVRPGVVDTDPLGETQIPCEEL